MTVLLTSTLISQLRSSQGIQISRTNSAQTIPTTSAIIANMSASERTPLISSSTRSQIANAVPSKGQRIKVAEVTGALQAGKLP